VIGAIEDVEDLQPGGMRKANRGKRWKPGLSEALLRFRVPQDRQARASASEKIAFGKPTMLPLWAKTDARRYCTGLSEI